MAKSKQQQASILQSGKKFVSTTELKSLAEKHLPEGSTLKSLIMSEPDQIPRDEAVTKIAIYSKLLESELRQ